MNVNDDDDNNNNNNNNNNSNVFCLCNNFELIFQLYKQVDGHEISWALGAAFHILQNGL